MVGLVRSRDCGHGHTWLHMTAEDMPCIESTGFSVYASWVGFAWFASGFCSVLVHFIRNRIGSLPVLKTESNLRDGVRRLPNEFWFASPVIEFPIALGKGPVCAFERNRTCSKTVKSGNIFLMSF